MPTPTLDPAATDLKATWTQYQEEHPNVRIRNAAADLGVSEVELLATGCGEHVTRLRGPWKSILSDLEPLGRVMALTRNDAAVHEKKGLYANVRFFEDHNMGLAVNDDIDLRLFMGAWASAFAVTQATKAGARRSLQFFDAAGTAVHKVFLTRKSDDAAYDALVEAYRHDDQAPHEDVEAAATDGSDDDAPRPDEAIDAAGFLDAWAALEDTHDFFPLLREYDVARTQALRLAEGRFAERATPDALRRTLQMAAEREVPIMVFVGNPGCLQIHTGPVRTLRAMGPWYNVLDPGFQLHLNEELVEASWIVRKPTSDGTVTSLELYDADGWPIARLFGKRKPGIPELESWRGIVADLERA